MTASPTPRLALPLLAPGQAQKEMTHNEALVRIDIAVQASVVAELAVPPAAPTPGQCWLVGSAPQGAWSGNTAAIAGWTDGGWRFVAPAEGMRIWIVAEGAFALFSQGVWYHGRTYGRLFIGGDQVVGPREPNVAEPAGGVTVDAEARAAITAVLQTLRRHGLIEQD
ncbi:DUF2793 domain-containing protein [Sphingomonas elodea]|uniref:DUF2793 domain-containing protein n=1 Tax=Sphingomonas elodea TaxID=179878 RepID=UPI0002631E71|nr:DUF2793 domain-containing protein [Sphingomonas elodea]